MVNAYIRIQKINLRHSQQMNSVSSYYIDTGIFAVTRQE